MKNPNFNNKIFAFLIIGILFISNIHAKLLNNLVLYPKNNDKNISPDTHLKLTFKSNPQIGNYGKIRIYKSSNDSLVDELDMSIPAGPTLANVNPNATYTTVAYEYVSGKFTNANTKPGTPSGTALPTPNNYQLTIIGGFTDAFHFYPIIIHENTAIIYLHNNLLEYNQNYYVLVDSTIITPTNEWFKGIYNKNLWRFSTRKTSPNLKFKKLIVDNKGNGDFNTLQGALDYIPDYHRDTITIFIKNGLYEELIYFRNKSNIIIQGENRDSAIIQYANNEVFNPHPWNVKTNERPGTFPSRRAAFTIDNCTNIQLKNLTVKTLLYGQAEGLLINGNKTILNGVNIVGSGDALQTNGTAYFEDVKINGGGDMILGRGPAFFKDCDFYSPGPFMWIRNTETNHGNIFVNCKFTGTRPEGSELARAPTNKGTSYPYSEAVLINCSLKNIVSKGWGAVGEETKHLHYWEFNSINSDDGKLIDVSNRAEFSRQLNIEKDEDIIKNYANPEYVLDSWIPKSELYK
ncbi:MAG: pectinesterase family protein [Paludibacter sp.]|nr:pectinesterase family protein [Paludibacter sp.]